MSGPTNPGEVPPDVPQEYAVAYRTAYEQALRDLGTPEPPPADAVAAQDAPPPLPVAPPAPEPRPSAEVPEPRATEYSTARPAWFVPVAFIAAALVFVGCAYFLGRMVSSGESSADPTPAAQKPASTPEATPTVSDSPTPTPSPASATPWKGAVKPIKAVSVTAACTAPPGVDSSGRRTTYAAANVNDANPQTAWRCEGKAIGQRLVLALPPGTTLGQVGLIPGYAKTDPVSGDDRYAENNRITRVRWHLADGTAVIQKMSGDPKDRSMRVMRVPQVAGDVVILEVIDVVKGKRNTTMISGIRLAATA